MNRTPIEWTSFTANPIKYLDAAGKVVWACVHASPGCQHCYAEALALRYGRGGPFNEQTMAGLTPFLDDAECHKMRTARRIDGLDVSGSRCFIGDMTDIFGKWISDDILDRLFSTVLEPREDVTWQILTKQAERMQRYLSQRWPVGRVPPRHIHVGVSAENQTYANRRIPSLLQTPAAVRFVSAEPLLSGVDFSAWLNNNPVHATRWQERGDSLPGGAGWVDRSSAGRIDLENRTTSKEPMGRDDHCPPSETTSNRRGRRQGLPLGQDHGRRSSDLLPGASSRVESTERPYPKGLDDQPQGRKEVAEPANQSGIGHSLGANAARLQDRTRGRTRRAESISQIDQSAGGRDPSSIPKWPRDPSADRRRLRRRISDDLEDSSRGQTSASVGSDEGLYDSSEPWNTHAEQSGSLHQIIIGGESGPRARPMNMNWARAIVQQCQAAGVPVFMKQLGAKPFEPYSDGTPFADVQLKSKKGSDMMEWDHDLRIRKFPVSPP